MKKILYGLTALVLVGVAYLLLWPVPITPASFALPQAPGYVGPHAINTRLANLQLIDLQGEVGPEHIVIGPDGKLYTCLFAEHGVDLRAPLRNAESDAALRR